MEERRDFKLSGAGTVGGGVYNEVKLSGACKITGDIDCNFMKVSGACSISANIKAKQFLSSGATKGSGNIYTEIFKSSGSIDIMGNLTAKDVNISGSASIDGDISSDKLQASGGCKIGGNVTGGEVILTGGIEINNNCEVEKFNSRGDFKIKGLLNSEEINIELYYHSYVKEIGGETINIRFNPHPFSMGGIIKSLFSSEVKGLKADTIEGDYIYLEYTTAKVVRGKKIIIGDNCNIEKVEYTDNFELKGNSIIGTEAKL